jgi:uncharacterized iron-regulated membrane protein
MDRATLYRTIWRWHFYAGLFVIPFILLLATTGSLYLFKPQIDAWEESAWRGPPLAAGEGMASPDVQVAAAMAAAPGATLRSYRLPRAEGEPAVVWVDLPDAGGQRELFVAASGQVTAIVDPAQRWSNWLQRLHGSLLLGLPGGLLVETAASWAIVLILSGLYLWWPRGRGLAGVVWPRLNGGKRAAWRDLHAVTGFWVSGLALVLLVSGLPWTDGWASAFRMLRQQAGWVNQGPQDWKGGMTLNDHGSHGDHGSAMPSVSPPTRRVGGQQDFTSIAFLAQREALPFPVIIQPPGAPSRFGPPNGPDWKVSSEAQNRPLIRSVTYNAQSGAVTGRQGFADKHPIDRVINYGIAWHEGQLFGWVNQLIGVLTGLALVTIAVSGTMMWWRRRVPGQGLDAPPLPPERGRALMLLLVIPALLLPMMLASLLIVALVDFVLSRRRTTPAN